MNRIPVCGVLLLVVLLLVSGCTVPFKGFRSIKITDDPRSFNAVPADANLSVVTETPVFDTVLYSRKLNGGLNAQVVGNKQFIVVPTLNERVYFLHPNTGKEISSFRTESSLGSAAAIAGEMLYFVDEQGGDRLTCMNLVNSKIVFSKKISDSPGPPVVDGEDLFIASRIGRVYRMSRLDGDTAWTYPTSEMVYSSPTVDDVHVYAGTDRGNLICLDRASGRKLWSFKAGGAIFARPVVGKYLYCPSGDGILYALDKTSGALMWSFTSSGSVQTTPAVANGRIYFGSDDWSVYCLDAESGGLVWAYETDGVVQSSPLVSQTSLIVGNATGGLYQFDLNGNLRKTTRLKGAVTASPSVIDDKLFVVTRSRMLYCFGSSNPAN